VLEIYNFIIQKTKNCQFLQIFQYFALNILKRHDNGHTSGRIDSEGRNDLDSALSGTDVRSPF